MPFQDNPEEVVFLNPFTCGVYKDGGARYKIDPATGQRTEEIDNELREHVDLFKAGSEAPGTVRTKLEDVFSSKVLAPRYYDDRWAADFDALLARDNLLSISLGELAQKKIINVRGGHGSPSNDNRRGNIPYVKVSDIRSLRVNVNPTNLVTKAVAEAYWRKPYSGLQAWDLISPNRASSNIGEFAVLLPGEEQIVVTKEVFIIRVVGGTEEGWDAFYLLWALCLKEVRRQWQRVILMQTNREDVGDRWEEIRIPIPHSLEWARQVSSPFREYFISLANARTKFLSELTVSGYKYIASAHSTGSLTVDSDEEVVELDENETPE